MDRALDALVAVIIALLSVGGAAFVRNLFAGWKTLRSGAQARERKAVADLIQRREDAEADRDYWRRIAGRYAGQLERFGHEPDPANPVPPSERS